MICRKRTRSAQWQRQVLAFCGKK